MTQLELPVRPNTLAQSVAGSARTLPEAFLRRVEATPGAAANFHKVDGAWQGLTWKQTEEQALAIAGGLQRAGVDVGDRVAVLGPTSLEWALWDLGGLLAGAVTLGVYPRQSAEQIRYLLEHSESVVVSVADRNEMESVLEAASGLDSLRHIVAWTEELATAFAERDPRVQGPGAFRGEPIDAEELTRRLEAIDSGGPAIMVYTSGTTGPPKAAMISHENVLTLMEHISEFFPYRDNDLLFAFLPMAHVTERVLAFYGRIAVGVPAAYASSIGAVLDELPEVRPTVFGSVPRLFEKLYDRVQGQVEKAPAAKRKLFRWGESVARRRFDLLQADRPVPALLGLQYRIASKLVFAKIHDAFGGRVRACITGAAPISMEILTFLWSIDLPIFEAYGMTEATVLTHANHFGAVKLGTVGRSVPTIEMRIAEDGEILLRGPLVFLGYFKNPEATAETLSDGWLHSGDIGEVDEDGFLRITDRKKHLIITAGGKNVAPANIERAIKNQSPLISNVHAHGDRRRYISALITPSPLDTLDWGLEHGVLQADVVEALRQELQADPSARSEGLEHAMRQVVARRDFQDLFVEPVQRGNTALAKVEKVKRFVVLDRDFSQEGGEMTPTMKMRRGAIEKKYVELFDKIYTDDSFSLVAEDRAS